MSTVFTGYQHHHDCEQGPRAHQADAAGHHQADGRIAWAVADGVGNHADAPAAARRAVATSTKTAASTGVRHRGPIDNATALVIQAP